MIRTPWKMLLVIACLLATFAPAEAQAEVEGVRGKVTDTTGQPVEGIRVVFEPLQGAHTFLSQPTSATGDYVVSLPRGGDFMVVAVINSTGQRTELPGQRPFKAESGTTRDLVIDVAAQLKSAFVTLNGILRDSAGELLVGYRVVLRQMGTNDVVVGSRSDPEGAYVASLKDLVSYEPIAVVTPEGRRIELVDEERLQATRESTRDIVVPAPRGSRPVPEPGFPGGDRLYLNFIEDAAIVEHWRLEFQYENLGRDSDDANILRAIAAKQFKALPQLELGARLGLGDADVPSLVDGGSGLTDLDLWAKLRLGPLTDGTVWTPGVKLTLPTGRDTPGLGADALGVKLFAAARQRIPHGVISYNAAIEVTEDGRVGDVLLDGTVAPSAGIAYVYAHDREFSVIGEMFFGFERFEDAGADIRIAGGVNWKVPDLFTVRASLVGGLSDGAPDYQLLLGVSFDY